MLIEDYVKKGFINKKNCETHYRGMVLPSKVRHARLKGTSFGDDLQPVKFYLDNIVVKTWSLHTDKTSFTEAQLSDIDHGLAGSRRSMELVPANRCSLANCPVAAEEEELKARMDNVANDFLNFFNQAFNMA